MKTATTTPPSAPRRHPSGLVSSALGAELAVDVAQEEVHLSLRDALVSVRMGARTCLSDSNGEFLYAR